MAYNYKRNESDPKFYSIEEINNIVDEKGLKQFNTIDSNDQNLQETLQELNNGKQLWQYFLALAILFIILEALVIRLWK